MARKTYTAEHIIGMLREVDVRLSQGEKVGAICRSLSVSEQSHYRWCREYGGLKVTQATRMKALEKENARLRKAVSNLTLDGLILKEVIEGKF
jgi:putative transposase